MGWSSARAGSSSADVRFVALILAPTPVPAALPAVAIRLAAGGVFVGFGQSKFVHHAKEARAFDRYGLPGPDVFVYATGTLEVALGLALLLGLLTRLTALGLAGNMVGAIATGGRVDGGFVNLVLAPILLMAMLALVRLGAGRLSVDEDLARRIRPAT